MMNSDFRVPILFLVFNRPTTTKKVFNQIRKIKPAFLYIAADGPRKEKEGEQENCDRVRKIVTNIDWPCEVKTLFRDENLGCGRAVSQAISWFFEDVEEGIILEDDCLPDVSFFPYCSQLLERYRHDKRIFSISGSNLLGTAWKAQEHSYFWALPGIWGWATWRRAWKFYDFKMTGWEEPEIQDHIREGLVTKGWYNFYYPMFEATFKGRIDTWDVQWLFTTLINSGLAANPAVNLVRNLGFGRLGTNTGDKNNPIALLTTHSLNFPLKHPLHFLTDIEYLDKMLLSIRDKINNRSGLIDVLNNFKNLINKGIENFHNKI